MRLNVYSVRTELKGDMAQQRPSVPIHREHPKAAILEEGNIFWTVAGAVDGIWMHYKNLAGSFGRKQFHKVKLKSPDSFIYLVNMTRVTNFT